MRNKRRLLLLVGSTLICLMITAMVPFSIKGISDPTIINTDTPAVSVTPTVTDTPTVKPTEAPTASPEVSETPVPTADPAISLTPTPEPTLTDEFGDTSQTPVPTEAASETPAPTEEAQVTATPSPTPEYYETNVVMISCKTLNVRSGPDTSYSKVGQIYNGCYATLADTEEIVEKDGSTTRVWIKINSGSLAGQYICKEENGKSYVYQGYDAACLIDNMKGCTATITKATNLLQGPCVSEDFTKTAYKGETYTVLLAESTAQWLCVEIDDYTNAYINAKYATLSFNMDTGLTNYEIKMNTFAGRLEETLASSKNVPIETIPKTNRNDTLTGDTLTFFQNYQMSDLERDFFAATIQAEVGGHPYEGKLAAANVVINRLLMRTEWTGGSTITGVLSKPHQFAGANVVMTDFQLDEEKLAKYKSKINADCYRAVDEAMAGINNIPNYIFFHATSAAYSEKMGYPIFQYTMFTYIGDTYFFNGYY